MLASYDPMARRKKMDYFPVQCLHGQSACLCGGHPQGCGVPETSCLACPLGHRALLHGQGGGLSAAPSTRAAHSREADDAKDRAQALDITDPSQTFSP